MNNRGPRSSHGKAAISNNGLKHGLTGAATVLPSEDAADWDSFREDVCSQFSVEGSVETALASRVAELLWRLRRVARAEQQSVSVSQFHRDALAHNKALIAAASAGQPLELEGPVAEEIVAEAALLQRLNGRLGIYASGVRLGEETSRYERTLPVLLPDDKQLDRIMRYEAHLNRLLNHTLHELEALQDRRRGNPAHLARVDIN